MAFIEREFYRSPHGPTAADQDVWFLVFDANTRQLYVRHEWHVRSNKGVETFDIDEFFMEPDVPHYALVEALFQATVNG